MRFLDHLEVLRRKLLVALFMFFILLILFLIWSEPILHLFLSPIRRIPITLVFLKPAEKFMAYLKASGYGAFLCSIPVLLLQVGSFVFPALRGKERPIFMGLLGGMLLLFLGGIYFAYQFLIPFLCTFFYSFNPDDGILPYWSIEGYVDLVFFTILVFAGVFQTPLFLLFLLKVGILRLETLRKYRRHTIVGIFLLAALLTPPDVFSQVLVGGILYLLFEITLFLGKWIVKSGGSDG
ncbi:MAG: twin-arginine translocase subunit TatC [Spirochaetes bacterium]|nr:twin-arginine translocase subunit TatC [Spirochaetota bacterium]